MENIKFSTTVLVYGRMANNEMGRTWKETVVAKSDVTLLINLKQISVLNISA